MSRDARAPVGALSAPRRLLPTSPRRSDRPDHSPPTLRTFLGGWSWQPRVSPWPASKGAALPTGPRGDARTAEAEKRRDWPTASRSPSRSCPSKSPGGRRRVRLERPGVVLWEGSTGESAHWEVRSILPEGPTMLLAWGSGPCHEGRTWTQRTRRLRAAPPGTIELGVVAGRRQEAELRGTDRSLLRST